MKHPFATPLSVRPHWNYFLALENDVQNLSRYVEFCTDNLNVYSIELAHLLFSAASEVDTLAKCICGVLDPKEKPNNINDYRRIVKAGEDAELYGNSFINSASHEMHRISHLKVHIPRYGLEFVPWASWATNKNPDWWRAYNNVKHERNRHFNQATLSNALQAVAALLAINYVYCRLEMTKTKPKSRWQYQGKIVTRRMEPESTFMRFGVLFYDNPIANLGEYMSSISDDVARLSREASDREQA